MKRRPFFNRLLTALLSWALLLALLGALLAAPITDGIPSGTDISQVLFKAFAAARTTHQTVTIGDGTWVDSIPLVEDGFDFAGQSQNSRIYYTGPATASALTVVNTGNANLTPTLRDFSLWGPGRGTLGVRLPKGAGIVLQTPARVIGVRSAGFDAGVTNASAQGHVFLENDTLTDCYYGFYNTVATGDVRISYCALDGNTMASIGETATGGITSSSEIGTHNGFSPYGVYQEPGAISTGVPFLSDVTFIDSPFEACGNAALASDVLGTQGSNRASFDNVTILRAGFSWDADYRIASRPRDYALAGDLFWKTNTIAQGSHPFLPGDKAVFGFAQVVINDPNGTLLLDNVPQTNNRAMTNTAAEAALAPPAKTN